MIKDKMVTKYFFIFPPESYKNFLNKDNILIFNTIITSKYVNVNKNSEL